MGAQRHDQTRKPRSGGFKANDPRTKALGEQGRQANNFLRKFRETKKKEVKKDFCAKLTAVVISERA